MIKIEKIEIIHIRLPIVHTFTTGFGTVKEKDSVLVKMYANGCIGYGEGSSLQDPLYIPEFTDESYLVLQKYLAPNAVGKEFANPETFAASYSHIRGHSFAKTALECAFWDIYAQTEGKSIKDLVGGTQIKIEVGESLGIKPTVEEVLEEVGVRLAEGYRRIKLKIKPGFDVEVVKAVREKFGDIKLMVDGNSSYTLAHVDTFKALDAYGLTMIEQPLGYDDIIDHAVLQKQITTPICLDESILSAEDARKAISIGACKIINIKPGRVGGLVEAKKIHDLCAENNIGVWCGGMLETGIGRYFNLSIASLPNFVYAADMSPSTIFYKEDIVERPFVVKDGFVIVPTDLQKDFGVSEEKITKYTVKREVFE